MFLFNNRYFLISSNPVELEEIERWLHNSYTNVVSRSGMRVRWVSDFSGNGGKITLLSHPFYHGEAITRYGDESRKWSVIREMVPSIHKIRFFGKEELPLLTSRDQVIVVDIEGIYDNPLLPDLPERCSRAQLEKAGVSMYYSTHTKLDDSVRISEDEPMRFLSEEFLCGRIVPNGEVFRAYMNGG